MDTPTSTTVIPYIIHVWFPARNAGCSAVLVSPVMVATANHCVVNNGGQSTASIQVGLTSDVTQLDSHIEHTFSRSGPILFRLNAISETSALDSARDVALFRSTTPSSGHFHLGDVF